MLALTGRTGKDSLVYLVANWEGFALAKTKKAKSTAVIDNRKGNDRRAAERRSAAMAIAKERRVGVRREKVNRRRQIDPTTCERNYTDAEIEFMHAIDQYKRASGRMFPTCSEMLEVLISLGYEKTQFPTPAAANSVATKHCAVEC